MTSLTLFGFCGAALVGLGLYGVLCHAGAPRKIIALNVLDSGVFLLFGVIARRGGGSLEGETALGSDPVPQALVITGLVVAFAATALGVALVLRLAAANADAERGTALARAQLQAPGTRESAAITQPRPLVTR